MKVEQIYTGCLAQGAYYIQSGGEALIIDPLREIKPYLERAEKDGAKIKYILETHFHADFVSGHVDLAKASGGTIVFGPNAAPGFPAHIAKDGEELTLGKVRIRVLHTPGHTMESATYLLIDETGKEIAIFTGDTLFIGDVGRPDLAVKTDLTREDLAGHLYDSLRNKIMTLPPDVVVYPGHGAGSACGKNMSKETSDTLGNQMKFNYALRADMTKDEFIQEVTAGLTPPPAYFPENVRLNKQGYQNIEDVLSRGTRHLSLEEFEFLAEEREALLLDTRSQEDFVKGFIPGSVFIGIDGNFAPWAGTLIPDLKQAILIIADPGREEEVVTRLSRVGFDNTLGCLSGGFQTWANSGNPVDSLTSVSADYLKEKLAEGITIVDVRREAEYDAGHIESAQNKPLDYLNQHMSFFQPGQPYFVHCAGGYRSVIAASILKARGIDGVIDVAGGFKAIVQAGIPITEPVGSCGR